MLHVRNSISDKAEIQNSMTQNFSKKQQLWILSQINRVKIRLCKAKLKIFCLVENICLTIFTSPTKPRKITQKQLKQCR